METETSIDPAPLDRVPEDRWVAELYGRTVIVGRTSEAWYYRELDRPAACGGRFYCHPAWTAGDIRRRLMDENANPRPIPALRRVGSELNR